MKKLLLLLFIPFACFGQGPVNVWFNGKDKIIYYDSLEKQVKYDIRYYYDESVTGLDAELMRLQYKYEQSDYDFEWGVELITPTTVFRTATSFYRNGSLARKEKRILDTKNSKTHNGSISYETTPKIGFNYAGNVFENHHTILGGDWKNELEYDYYVYDGITTIYDSSQSTWMYKFFWISGWYIDVWKNDDWTLWVRYAPEERDLNRELATAPKSNIDYYNIESLIKIFIEDCINNNLILPFFDIVLGEYIDSYTGNPKIAPFYHEFVPKIKATFESLDGNSIGSSYGYMDDRNVIIKIDPINWKKSSLVKRWYLLYHELGHDILNLDHGEGGKMMFNFVDKEYTWEDFIEDRKTMFDIYKSKYDLILPRKKEKTGKIVK